MGTGMAFPFPLRTATDGQKVSLGESRFHYQHFERKMGTFESLINQGCVPEIRPRRLFCQLVVKKMGYPGEEVARFWGVTTSAATKAASSA